MAVALEASVVASPAELVERLDLFAAAAPLAVDALHPAERTDRVRHRSRAVVRRYGQPPLASSAVMGSLIKKRRKRMRKKKHKKMLRRTRHQRRNK